jgi:hypothetical protein
MKTEIPDFGFHLDPRRGDEAAGDEAARWLLDHDEDEAPADTRGRYARDRERLAAQRLRNYHRTSGAVLGPREGLRQGPTPKLTPDEVLTIRAIVDTDPDATMPALAAHFNVSRETIWAVITRRSWRGL